MTVILAPATTARSGSVTVPMIRPVAVCALAELQAKNNPTDVNRMYRLRIEIRALKFMTPPNLTDPVRSVACEDRGTKSQKTAEKVRRDTKQRERRPDCDNACALNRLTL